MAAVSTAVKKFRAPGPQNEPVMVYFGTFGPMPLPAGNYHLWDLPSRIRFIGGHVEIDTPAGSAAAAILGVTTNVQATAPAGSTQILFEGTAFAAGTAAIFTFLSVNTHNRILVPTDTNRYVLQWNREAAVTGNGETFTICLLAIRDDLN